MNVAYEYKDALLKIDNVCVDYDGRPILKNLSAEVRDIVVPGKVTGQIAAILGPSGVGKTTLFRVMAGLMRPTSGQVLIGNGNGMHPVRAGEVGVVAQSYPLYAHRSVFGNLMLPALAHAKSRQEAKQVVMDGLAKFGLEDKAKMYPAQLSGGQRQRVAILQMIICRERVILMDEPFSGLDLVMLERTCQTISDAANIDEENTIIVVTHDTTAAVSVADHIWLLGRDRDAQGNPIPGARIMQTYDLLERGLCYERGAITNPKFMETIREIKDRFRTL